MEKNLLKELFGPQGPLCSQKSNFTPKYNTLAKTEIIYPKNVRAKVAMDFT
jgi:hypothetical protein